MANTNTLATALLAAQGEFPPIPKDKENPHFRSRYSSLDAIETACWPVLRKHGLLPRHKTTQNNGTLTVTFLLTHVESGENDETSLSIEAGATAQAIGSQITYLRRYTCAPALGICSDEDDDGNAATPKAEPKRQARQAPATREKPAPKAKETFTEPPNWPQSSGEELVAWAEALGSPAAMLAGMRLVSGPDSPLTPSGKLSLVKGIHQLYGAKISGSPNADKLATITKEMDALLAAATNADLDAQGQETFG